MPIRDKRKKLLKISGDLKLSLTLLTIAGIVGYIQYNPVCLMSLKSALAGRDIGQY